MVFLYTGDSIINGYSIPTQPPCARTTIDSYINLVQADGTTIINKIEPSHLAEVKNASKNPQA